MRFRSLFGAALVVAAGAISGLVGATGIASAAPGTAYTCAGGDFASGNFTSIPSGDYASITVTGVCNIVPGAVINVTGNINVAAGAVLDAQSYSSTITVGHNITADAGSFLGLGCQPSGAIGRFGGVPCIYQPNQSGITVSRKMHASDPAPSRRREAHANRTLPMCR